MYYTQEQIDRANKPTFASFLQGQGEHLSAPEKNTAGSGMTAPFGNKWYRHSQSGAAPVILS